MGEQENDPRSVANFILDVRRLTRLETTQIELQKLLYFSYESYLIRFRRKLASGYFEAWKYGPVHPVVYRAFRSYKGRPITKKATAIDPFTKSEKKIRPLADQTVRMHVTEVVGRLSVFSAAQLVSLSHEPGGAWHSTVESAKKGVALGLRMTDDVILMSRPYSMLRAGGLAVEQAEELFDDETPIAGTGSG